MQTLPVCLLERNKALVSKIQQSTSLFEAVQTFIVQYNSLSPALLQDMKKCNPVTIKHYLKQSDFRVVNPPKLPHCFLFVWFASILIYGPLNIHIWIQLDIFYKNKHFCQFTLTSFFQLFYSFSTANCFFRLSLTLTNLLLITFFSDWSTKILNILSKCRKAEAWPQLIVLLQLLTWKPLPLLGHYTITSNGDYTVTMGFSNPFLFDFSELTERISLFCALLRRFLIKSKISGGSYAKLLQNCQRSHFTCMWLSIPKGDILVWGRRGIKDNLLECWGSLCNCVQLLLIAEPGLQFFILRIQDKNHMWHGSRRLLISRKKWGQVVRTAISQCFISSEGPAALS